jgi:hypothetical protein
MECSICYEQFLRPKTKKDFVILYNENVKNDDDIGHFLNLIITTKHNKTHSCSTKNCEGLFCNHCWMKITSKGDHETPTCYYFMCPFCRQIDFKNYKIKY